MSGDFRQGTYLNGSKPGTEDCPIFVSPLSSTHRIRYPQVTLHFTPAIVEPLPVSFDSILSRSGKIINAALVFPEDSTFGAGHYQW
ncbi:MAG TPA: hypothetical protein PKE58_12040, partial [Acidobacteriota bacterium]|nr:hypothetical protein [Acidobacteriota bacterium]